MHNHGIKLYTASYPESMPLYKRADGIAAAAAAEVLPSLFFLSSVLAMARANERCLFDQVFNPN